MAYSTAHAASARRTIMVIDGLVHSDLEILGGTPVFIGTRVPLQNLFDYIVAGDGLDEFLDQFPSVGREQALATIAFVRDAMMAASADPAR